MNCVSPEPTIFEGETNRRITARALLRPTLEWLKLVVFDRQVHEVAPIPVTLNPSQEVRMAFLECAGRNRCIFDLVRRILGRVLGAAKDDVQLRYGNRFSNTVSAHFSRNGNQACIPNLLGLSAGEAAAFCMFANIIRDFDETRRPLNSFENIRGIVLVDEIDLHLHLNHQLRVLPRLIEAFPKVQFIITAHSPLFVMGMKEVFGDSGFEVRELPDGNPIDIEDFSEFEHAFGAFMRTNRFASEVLQQFATAGKPVVIVEGPSDKLHLLTAWKKLFPSNELPWSFEVSGGVGVDVKDGGADQLRTMLRGAAFHAQSPILGLFDFDKEGWPQFNSLRTTKGFEVVSDTHLKHKQRPVQSCLLPVPASREEFVDLDGKHFHLAIEHYYSDEMLRNAGLINQLPGGSRVFDIKSNGDKIGFAKSVEAFDPCEFENFRLLFDRLHALLGTCVTGPNSSKPAELELFQIVSDVGGTP